VPRDQVSDDAATLAKLVALARQSGEPWIADPEHNFPPACYLDWSCLPNTATQAYADGASGGSIGYGYTLGDFSGLPGDQASEMVCIPADGRGTRLFTIPTPIPPVPAGSGVSAYSDFNSELCVTGFGSPSTATHYGYVGPYAEFTSWGMWMPVPAGPGPTALGLLILACGWFIVGKGWVGATLKSSALTLPLATAIPLLVLPIDRYPLGAATILGSILVPLAMLPLAMDFLERMDRGRLRRVVGVVTLALAVASAACGLLGELSSGPMLLRAFFAGCVVFVPGLFAARPFHRRESGAGPDRGSLRGIAAGAATVVLGRFGDRLADWLARAPGTSEQTPRALIESVDILMASMTPGIAALALISPYGVDISPLLLWLAALLVGTRLIVRPLGRLATIARRQRDLVAAATEAERSRIAADIHDDALQDLTMLIRRLDAAGDTANADAAREIAARLRAICGDLRLPVLDDLGVGPALDWLCGRLGSAPDSITLDRLADESRLPADVELAVFRIAQEALSNAIRHGAAPIVVRYRAREGWVELEVDDGGPGIPDRVQELAEQSGHLGLLNMAQRAEVVGAALQIGRRPGGGTRVSAIWERSKAQRGATAPAPAPA
jgi:signal transduction histidine kinase